MIDYVYTHHRHVKWTIGAVLMMVTVLVGLPRLHAQSPGISIHQLESEANRDAESVPVPQPAPAPGSASHSAARALSARVTGYHPYWLAEGTHLSYDYEALTTIAYFSYAVDTATGSYSSVHGWTTTPVIEYAHARGVNVVLGVTNFGYAENAALLTNRARGDTLIATLIRLLRERNGDGVNIDFELVAAAQRDALTEFMARLATAVRSAIPDAEISMALPAVDWSNAFDKAALAGICDYLILMGYDYHWSTAPTAGPVAPLLGETYNVTRSVDTYLQSGVPPQKLLLGVPWYGYDWPVVDTLRMAATTARGTAVYYSTAKTAAQERGRRFDPDVLCPWYTFADRAAFRQAWYDDSLSLALKYDLATQRGLGGIGIWALGYDGGQVELWDGIKQAFGVPSIVADDLRTGTMQIHCTPNPVSGNAHIAFTLPDRRHVRIEIVDQLGRTCTAPVDAVLDAGSHTATVDTRSWLAGMYLCRITADGEVMLQKILVTR